MLIAAAIAGPQIRASFKKLLKAIFKWKIIAIYCLFIGWSILCAALLKASGFWTSSLLKDTIVWIFFSGLALVGRSVQARESAPFFKQLVQDGLGIAVVVEFICNLYTFPLWIEILLLPALTFLLVFHAIAKNTPGAESVYRLLGCPVIFADLAILGYVGHALYWQSQKLLSQDGVSQFALPIILAVFSIPILYFITLYSRHEALNIAINLNKRKAYSVRVYICLKLLDHLRLNHRDIGSVHRRFISELMAVQTHDEVDIVFTDIRQWSDFRRGGPEAIKMRSIERSLERSTKINWPLIPLFKTPWIAAESVIQLGLKDTSDGEPAWRFLDEEWYALSRLDIKADEIFGTSNTITCMHGSSDEYFIEWSRWKFDIFDAENAEETTENISILTAQYLASLKCEIPPDLFKIPSKTTQRRETLQAVFEIQNFTYPNGYGWQMTITTKFEKSVD